MLFACPELCSPASAGAFCLPSVEIPYKEPNTGFYREQLPQFTFLWITWLSLIFFFFLIVTWFQLCLLAQKSLYKKDPRQTIFSFLTCVPAYLLLNNVFSMQGIWGFVFMFSQWWSFCTVGVTWTGLNFMFYIIRNIRSQQVIRSIIQPL